MKLIPVILVLLITLTSPFVGLAQLNPVEIPDFTLTDVVSNNQVSLSDYNENAAVVVIFTSNSCAYSKLYEDRILDLSKKYESQSVKFILINSNNSSLTDADNIQRMTIKANSKKYPFPYLADKENVAKNIFQPEKNPEAFVLAKKKGGFTKFYQGAIDDNPQSAESVENNYIVLALNNILEGKSSPIQYKRPVGCRIKNE